MAKRAIVNINASLNDAEIVAAVAGKKIRVLALIMMCGGTATTITFKSKLLNGATTAISPLLAQAANGLTVLPECPGNGEGWIETNAGESLTVDTGAGSATGILVLYVEV